MASKVLTWEKLTTNIVHKRLYLFQWNLQQFFFSNSMITNIHVQKTGPKKINYTMKVISSCIAFFVGIGRRLCCYEALVIGDQTWFITKFSHSRSSLLQSLSLLFPVLGYVLFPMLLDTIKSNHLVLNRPPPICRYCSVKRQPGPELTSFMVTCYHNTIQIELRVFPRTILLMVSWIDRKMQWK